MYVCIHKDLYGCIHKQTTVHNIYIYTQYVCIYVFEVLDTTAVLGTFSHNIGRAYSAFIAAKVGCMAVHRLRDRVRA